MAGVSRRENPKTTPLSEKGGDAMQEKTIRLIIKIAQIVLGVAILIKDILFNGGNNGKSGNSKKK